MRIELDPEDLLPLIEQVATEVLARLEADHALLAGRLGYTEAEAAATLGIPRHSLRDARLRGEIDASRIGKRVVYGVDDLKAYLRRSRA